MIDDFYTIKEFAEKLKISSRTVRRMIDNRLIHAFRMGSTAKGSYRIPGTEITRIASDGFKNRER